MSTHVHRPSERGRETTDRAGRADAAQETRQARSGGISGPTALVFAVALLATGFAFGRWSASPPVRMPVRHHGGSSEISRITPHFTAAHGGAAATPLAGGGVFRWVQAQPPLPQLQAPANPQELVPLPGGPGNRQGQQRGQQPGQRRGQQQGQAQGNCQLFMFRDGRMFQFSPGQQGLPGQQGPPGQQASPFQGPGNGSPFGGQGGPQEVYPLQPLPSPGQPSPGRPSPGRPSPFSPSPPQAPMPPPSMSQSLPPPSGTAWRGPSPSARVSPRTAAASAGA